MSKHMWMELLSNTISAVSQPGRSYQFQWTPWERQRNSEISLTESYWVRLSLSSLQMSVLALPPWRQKLFARENKWNSDYVITFIMSLNNASRRDVSFPLLVPQVYTKQHRGVEMMWSWSVVYILALRRCSCACNGISRGQRLTWKFLPSLS